MSGKKRIARAEEIYDEALRMENAATGAETPGFARRSAIGAMLAFADRETADLGQADLPDDVRRLVIAARNVAFDGDCGDFITELDAASEAFADRVPWEDGPEKPS